MNDNGIHLTQNANLKEAIFLHVRTLFCFTQRFTTTQTNKALEYLLQRKIMIKSERKNLFATHLEMKYRTNSRITKPAGSGIIEHASNKPS